MIGDVWKIVGSAMEYVNTGSPVLPGPKVVPPEECRR